MAELRRRHGTRGRGFRWWAYCPAHLYGRRIEDGKVLCAVLPDSPAAKHGYTGSEWGYHGTSLSLAADDARKDLKAALDAYIDARIHPKE